MKSLDYPIVQVIWYDAESHDEWEDISDINGRKIKPIHTVGYLIEDHAEHITLAMNLDETNEKISMVMVIPNFWIEELSYLEKI